MCHGYSKDISRYNDIHYGTCFHLYMQVLAQTNGDHDAAQKAAIKCWVDKENIITRSKKEYIDLYFLMYSIEKFHKQYGHNTPISFEGFSFHRNSQDIPFVEQKLVLPYYQSDEFDLNIVGTVDCLGSIGQAFVLLDYKTTSAYDSTDFFSKYEISNQMLLYTWVIRQMIKLNPNSELAEIFSQHPAFGCTIMGAFHKKGNVVFQRGPIMYFPERRMEMFENALYAKLDTILRMCKKFIRTPNVNTYEGLVNGTCKMYGAAGCDFVQACLTSRLDDEMAVLNASFNKSPYNPLTTHEDI